MNSRMHAKITDLAILTLVNQNSIDTAFKYDIETHWKVLRRGSVSEDWPPPRTIYHGYNPYTNLGWDLLTTTAPSLGMMYIAEAAAAFNDNKHQAYYKLGRAIHLLEDMGTPAHVHAPLHRLRDDYESYLGGIHINGNNSLWSKPHKSHKNHLTTVQEPNLHSLFYDLAKNTYDLSSWVKRDGFFVNKFDSGKRLPTSIRGSKSRRATYEDISNSWYVGRLSDHAGRQICNWYLHELMPLTISSVIALLTTFWHMLT